MKGVDRLARRWDATRSPIPARNGWNGTRSCRIVGGTQPCDLRHGRRELSSLLAVLDALDTASLERKRPITLPLLREMMQQGLEI